MSSKKKNEEMRAFSWVLNAFATVALQRVSKETGDETGLLNLPIAGFNFSRTQSGEVPNPENTNSHDVVVEIYPVGWPQQSHISCRFVRDAFGWKPLRGEIDAHHSGFSMQFEVAEQLERHPPYELYPI